MNTTKKAVLAAFTIACVNFCTIGNLHSQTDSTGTYNESVIVVGDYNPVLDGVTEKVNVAPAVNDNISAELQPKFTYSITPRRISSLTSTTGLKAAKVIGSPTKIYNNYLRFGMGHDFVALGDWNPLLDLYYMSTRHEEYSYGARLFHETNATTHGRKSALESEKYGHERASVSSLDLFGKYILKQKHAFNANFSFERDYGRYYGFSDSTLANVMNFNRDIIKYSDYAFAYNNLALNLGAKSLNTDVNQLGYDANVGLADMWGRWDQSQLSIDMDGSVHYGFPMFRKYKAIAYLHGNWQGFKQKYDGPSSTEMLPLGFDTSSTLPDSIRYGRHLLTLNPYVDFLFNGFKIHAGFAVGWNAYDDSSSTTHNLFPDIAVSKSLASNRISLTVGFNGGYHANDWNSMRLYNPYILPAPDTRATVENNLYARMRVNFSKKLILNVSLDNRFTNNSVFYQLDNSYTLHNVFKPYYLDVNNTTIGADFTFVNDEMIEMTLGANYYLYYSVPDNTYLLYTPDFTAHLDAKVNYKDTWLFTLQTILVSSMDAEIGDDPQFPGLKVVTNTLPARFGMSLGVEYVKSRALSFFAKIDNVTCQRYFLWANYPSERLNAMLGLTYTIP